MAKMTVADYRSIIRSVIDLEIADLPDALIDHFLRESARRAQRWNQGQWPFYKHEWTVTWPDATAVQTLTELNGLHGDTEQIGLVYAVRSDDYRWFKYLSHSDFARRIERDDTTSGTARAWVPLGRHSIRLWPTPSPALNVTLFGWQEGSEWVSGGAGSTSDMPEDFDDAIFNWAMGRIYATQDEPQTSLYYMNTSDMILSELEDKYDASPPTDLVMNGEPAQYWFPETPGRAPYDWEI